MNLGKVLASQVDRRHDVAIVTLLSIPVIAGIGLADYVTGYDLSFGLFYVAPVSALSWFVSRRAGVAGAVLSAIVWLMANTTTAPPSIPSAVIVWNTMIRLGFFAIIAVLVSGLCASHSREKEMARSDALTGLMNLRAFRESANIELMRARRSHGPLSLLYLDLDEFKALNDRVGHAAGDEVLAGFARTLKSAVRATDVVGRLGGDEFVVLLPDTSETHAERVAANIHRAVSVDRLLTEHGIGVSIGIATAIEIPSNIDELLGIADSAMYEAKRGSRSEATGIYRGAPDQLPD